MATFPTVVDDDGTGTTGTILDNALFLAVRDYIGAAHTAVAHSGANFTTDTGSWTVDSADQEVYRWVEIGKTMVVIVRVSNSTVTSSPTQLRVAVPNGRTIASTANGMAMAVNAGAQISTSYWQATSGLSYIQFFRDIAATAWSGTNNVYVWAVCVFEIS